MKEKINENWCPENEGNSVVKYNKTTKHFDGFYFLPRSSPSDPATGRVLQLVEKIQFASKVNSEPCLDKKR